MNRKHRAVRRINEKGPLMNFIARWLATAVAVAAAAWIVPGIDIVGGDNA